MTVQRSADAADRAHLLVQHYQEAVKAWLAYAGTLGPNCVVVVVDLRDARYRQVASIAGHSPQSIQRQIDTCKASQLIPGAVFVIPLSEAARLAEQIGSPNAARTMRAPLPDRQMQVFVLAASGSQLARLPVGPAADQAN